VYVRSVAAALRMWTFCLPLNLQMFCPFHRSQARNFLARFLAS
jgi:hypothetical protein